MINRRPAGRYNDVPESSVQRAHFAPRPETVAAVRRFIRECLPDADPEIVHDATVLASEVATNVVDHALTDYEVRIRVSDRVLRVEIADGSSVIPAVKDLALDADRGRGLHMLAGLAQAWGVEEGPTGKDVWFELALHPRDDRD